MERSPLGLLSQERVEYFPRLSKKKILLVVGHRDGGLRVATRYQIVTSWRGWVSGLMVLNLNYSPRVKLNHQDGDVVVGQ